MKRPSNTKAHILWMVHTHPGLRRVDLAQESGLSKAAISATVMDLLAQGILLEAPLAGAGRRRIGLQINQQAGQAIGIELAATHCTAVLTDLATQLVRSATQTFTSLALSDAVRQAVAVAHGLIDSTTQLVGWGISAPGLIDADRETLLCFGPPAWAGEMPLAALVRECMAAPAAPITLINTFHAGTLAEQRCGAAQGIDDVLYLALGDTIGAGLILAGELYGGSSGSAGEVGHVAIDPHGAPCPCGNVGCLEAMAGAAAIIELTNKALHDQARDHLLTTQHMAHTLQDVIHAASAGDMAALAAIRQAGDYLGLAIAGWVNLLNPRRVILGGRLAEAGDIVLAPLRQAVLRRAAPAAYSSVDLVPAALGTRAAATGAAAVAIDRYLATIA